MIEIKGKRMILFPEDRLIGAQGDINTAEKVFVMEKIQSGHDLSNMVAWIKLDPIDSGDKAYNQLLKKEIDGDRIILRWTLTGANLKNAGELSAQIMLAAPEYFNENDLKNIGGEELVLPLKIEGVSAPVWQSYKETFIVAESIYDDIAYKEITKNVLTAAVADAAASAQSASQSYLETEQLAKTVNDNLSQGEILYKNMQSKANEVENNRIIAEEESKIAKNEADSALTSANNAKKTEESCKISEKNTNDNAYAVSKALDNCINIYSECQGYSEGAQLSAQRAEATAAKISRESNFRKIFEKTLTEDDKDCVSFEITQDLEGNPLNISDAVLYLFVPKMPNVSGTYLRLDGKPKGDKEVYGALAQFVGLSRTSDRYIRIETENKGRWVTEISKTEVYSANLDSISPSKNVCAQGRGSDGKNLVSLRLVQHYKVDAPFPAGMQVEVWAKEDFK